MGFFSWVTCDTHESIGNIHSGHCRPVFLLQPDAKPPVIEPSYEGRGEFGGVNAYVWLAEYNIPEDLLSTLDDEAIYMLGVMLETGLVARDTNTRQIWSIFHDSSALVGGSYFPSGWESVIPEYGKCANQLVKEGIFEKAPVSELYEIRYPLKFSFNMNARYEDHPASIVCQKQGFFY